MRSERYQIALIILGLVVTIFFGYFLYREVFPEYRIYQDDYVALEKFRSTYTGEPPPEFKEGVKQIVFEREDKGPARIDRCISCHVAMQLPHFSPTQIAYDVNGNIIRTADGKPVQEPNPNFVWGKLEQKVAELKDTQVNAQLTQEGETAKVKARLKEAEELEALKTAEVGEYVYDVTKVLLMHPLIGKETRPFEFHPVDDYGCISCHSGNGRGLTTDKAHGPVFDKQYEEEFMGPMQRFVEHDLENDPKFAHVFNHKPGDALLFQTSPLLVGNLIQGSCVQCHEQSSAALQGLADTAGKLAANKNKNFNLIEQGLTDEKKALIALVNLKKMITSQGLEQSIKVISLRLQDPALLQTEKSQLTAQVAFLEKTRSRPEPQAQQEIIQAIDESLLGMLGSKDLIPEVEEYLNKKKNRLEALDQFLKEKQDSSKAIGSLFVKQKTYQLEKALVNHVKDTQSSLNNVVGDEGAFAAVSTDVDWLTKNYHRGQQLYISQACYACHRIAGFSRGGVGPELTREGESYPWYIKNKLMWPQFDLKTSTMPNMHLDSLEIEDLMTYLLAQKGPSKAISETDYKVAVQEWEAGRKMGWEKPIPPSKVHDLRYSMTVFATEGCAACHRLEGFESNVGYSVEKEKDIDFDKLYQEHGWFKALFPEEIPGSSIVKVIEEHAKDIDKHISDDVRKNAILDEIEKKYPDSIESFYSNFRYAFRAKDKYYQDMSKNAPDETKRKEVLALVVAWKERVHRILMMYVQEYGLGRLIGPRPDWSGVYRSDEWLMEHFHNPAGHVPRSIMPILPFDDSKFYALTNMLDVLGKRNRDAVRAIWEHKGFDPDQAYQIHCAHCHGDYLQGNGPIATWIYPIPKNLRNAEFLRNLTKENAIQSIAHGVKGTPMPPWGETPKDKENYDGIPVLSADEIHKMVDWLYTSIPGGTVIRGSQDVPKWNYTPKDVLDELHREGSKLESEKKAIPAESDDAAKIKSLKAELMPFPLSLEKAHQYYAALQPKVYVSSNEAGIEDVFDIVPNPVVGEDKNAYYIQKKYYTEANIEQGKRFFDLNCAVCHGNDADGTGIRASVMVDAKPRMLTNLDWINTRDDLRLLRSIKYGVPGTGMTPWGDFSSSLQRIQLVMYIRSLSQEKEAREALMVLLYKSFDQKIFQLENFRIGSYATLDEMQRKYRGVQKEQKAVYNEAQDNSKKLSGAVELYKQQIETAESLKKLQEKDAEIVKLRTLIQKERDVYQNIGNQMMSSKLEEGPLWPLFFRLISLNLQPFTTEDGKISHIDLQGNQQTYVVKQMIDIIDANIDGLAKKQIVAEGKLPSIEKDEELHSVTTQLAMYNKIKSAILTGMEQIGALHEEEKGIVEALEAKKKDESL